tara:strand:+ start:1439 stop:2200 length:762 start_codon:yes stop_codon:yes gene_type:complete
MSEDVKKVGKDFAKDYLTSIKNQATADDDDTGDGAGDITRYDDPSLQSQIALMDIQNTQQQLNMETAAELDRIQREFYTTQDIRKGQAEGVEGRLSQMVGGEQQRLSARVAGEEQRKGMAESAFQQRLGQRVGGQEQRASMAEQGTQQRMSARVAGQEQRAGMAETGSQQRQSARVAGQESRAGMAEQGSQQRQSARVAGQEQRAGMAESGTQQRMTRRVEGEEVRETDLQREMFRRYKEARDYGQAQKAYRA